MQGQEQPVLLSPGMALATVAIGDGLPFWPKERPPLGHALVPASPAEGPLSIG